MTPITIAGKEYPWPEGCKHFEITPNLLRWFRIRPGDECGAYNWLVDDFSMSVMPIIAAVAARHFRNKEYAEVKINAVLFTECQLRGFMWEPAKEQAWRESRHRESLNKEAAEQWETLCHDL